MFKVKRSLGLDQWFITTTTRKGMLIHYVYYSEAKAVAEMTRRNKERHNEN